MRILATFLIACLLLSIFPGFSAAQISLGSTAPALNEEFLTPVISDDYLLGTGDQLETHIIVGDNALILDYTFVINPEGKIFFPNVGEMNLAGLSLGKAREVMVRKIKKKYPEKFELSLMVSNPKKITVYVTGQIDKPGLKSIPDGTRLSQFLKAIGVGKGGADFSEDVYVMRKKDSDFKHYKLKLFEVFLENNPQNILLENGDIVAVPAMKSYVYVYGEVARSGTYGYIPGQTLASYLNIAGGPTPQANLGSVTITRRENGRPKVYRINASDILQKGIVESDIEIYPGDVISVPRNFFYFSDFASFANTILLAFTLYSTLVK